MPNQDNSLFCSRIDQAGIMCSVFCTIHCIIMTIITVVSPFIMNYLESRWIHISLLALIIPIAIIAFYRGWKRHHRYCPVYLGTIGITFLTSAIILKSLLEVGKLETLLTTVGCFFLVSAHAFNMSFIQKSPKNLFLQEEDVRRGF